MKKIIENNPVLSLLLGVTPILALTTTVERAYMAGIIVFITILISNLILKLFKKVKNDNLKLTIAIIINAIIISVFDLIFKMNFEQLHTSMSIYLPLLTISSIVINSCSTKTLNSLKNGIYFLITITLIALVRELIGSGSITIMNEISSFTGYEMMYTIIPENSILPIPLFLTNVGGFLILACSIAIYNKIKVGDLK